MVHALYEAHRVLKPKGVLIDLRPAAAHRRVGIGKGRHWQFVAVLREPLNDDWAANRAVAKVVRDGLFIRKRHTEFSLDRTLDTSDEFRTWLDDFVQRQNLPSQEWLIKRVEREQRRQGTTGIITVRGPLLLSKLQKVEIA